MSIAKAPRKCARVDIARSLTNARTIMRFVKHEDNDLETSLLDLITDLRHWAAANGINWAEITAMSHWHFEAERRGD